MPEECKEREDRVRTSSTLRSARSHSCPTASTFAGYLRGIPCLCTRTQFCERGVSVKGGEGSLEVSVGRRRASSCLLLGHRGGRWLTWFAMLCAFVKMRLSLMMKPLPVPCLCLRICHGCEKCGSVVQANTLTTEANPAWRAAAGDVVAKMLTGWWVIMGA